ncbi:MAG: hypothetical protein LBL90_03230 [Prevotellaceae bacterium]|jgi:cell division protein FtsQ|nr:hypothetical protein [Prevotellaceae bacterium]
MKKYWSIIILSGTLAALVIYLVVTLNFASSSEDETLCTNINVQIVNKDDLNLVTAEDVISIIKSSGEKVIGIPMKNIAVYKIQELLDSKSFIKSVSVYTTIDGLLNVKLTQRVPVVRVHMPNGAFYIDAYGFVFPLSNTYTHYVPVVTGNMLLPFRLPYKGELPDDDNSKTLRDLLSFVGFLNTNSFWNAEIEQINILPNADVELIPRSGNYIIHLGKFDDYKYKLKKLYTFYTKVLPIEGWNKYSTLDLRYSNQVVATLKNKL